MVFWKVNNAFCITFCIDAIAYNVSHVCDVAPRLTEPRGHVAERRAAAPRSPSRPEGGDVHTCCYTPLLHIYINEFRTMIKN
jgi:hypothetical protein